MANENCGERFPAELRPLRFHTDGKHEKANADLAKKSQRFNRRCCKHELKSTGKNQSKKRRPEHDTGQHLANHCWLAVARQKPAERVRNSDDSEELKEKPT